MVPDGFAVALARLARLSEDEKKKQHKTELDFWTEQLKTQNARNILSYNRLKGTGIIGDVFGFFGVNIKRGETRYKSVEYINAVIQFMEDLVGRVDIRLNKDPDEDVLVMANSKYFIKSGGGFSEMIISSLQ